MCDEEVMSLIAEKLGSDLIVIPSSIHETIILKETENVSVTELNAMVIYFFNMRCMLYKGNIFFYG